MAATKSMVNVGDSVLVVFSAGDDANSQSWQGRVVAVSDVAIKIDQGGGEYVILVWRNVTAVYIN